MSQVQESSAFVPAEPTAFPPMPPDPDGGTAPMDGSLSSMPGSVGGFGLSGSVVGSRRNRWGETQTSVPEETLRLPSVPLVVVPAGEPSEKERMDTELLKRLVSSYYAIVKLKIADVIPKTIMRFMVNAVRNELHHECIAELYRSDLVTGLLQEAEDVRQRRLHLEQTLEELRRAQDVLTQVSDAAIHT